MHLAALQLRSRRPVLAHLQSAALQLLSRRPVLANTHRTINN